jgi:aspartate/glutamate racemase
MFNRIGILGGMGPQTTLYFLNRLFDSLSNTFHPKADQDYPDVSILMENSTPDRTEEIKKGGHEASQRINRAIASMILSGCDPVVLPCITAHALVEQRWFDAGVIDFRRCIIDNYESIYTDQIAVLATEGALISDVFTPLDRHFDLVYPDDAQRKKMMSVIYGPRGLKSSEIDIDVCKTLLQNILVDFRQRGIDYFLAGSTEIESFIGDHEVEGNFMMPMDLMCDEIIDRVRGGVLK